METHAAKIHKCPKCPSMFSSEAKAKVSDYGYLHESMKSSETLA